MNLDKLRTTRDQQHFTIDSILIRQSPELFLVSEPKTVGA